MKKKNWFIFKISERQLAEGIDNESETFNNGGGGGGDGSSGHSEDDIGGGDGGVSIRSNSSFYLFFLIHEVLSITSWKLFKPRYLDFVLNLTYKAYLFFAFQKKKIQFLKFY